MENWLGRFMRNSGPARFFIPVGIILIIFGAFLLMNTPKEYGETTGTVTGIREVMPTDEDEQISYDVLFDYTVDGKQYSSEFSGLFEAPAKGDTVTVYYDPADPQKTSNSKDTGLISYIMIGAGAIATVYGVFATVKAFQKSKELDDQIKNAVGSDEMPEIIALDKADLAEYYVSLAGDMLHPGYEVEDEDRDIVFEAPMTKQALVGARIFTFTNHKTGEVKEHEVGHTMSQTYNESWFGTRSWFKFDGENIWDYLHERGVRIETDLTSIMPKQRYTISINGKFAATVETSSKYVHEEDEAEHKVAVPFGKYYYRIWTNEPDIELIFLTVFAISETEQTVVE